MTAPPRFALIGAAGFVAPRHLDAIKHVGGKLVAALDPHDAVGILDRYDRETEFFTEEHRFERHLQREPVDWVVVCSPNYLHYWHTKLGLRVGAKVICEKPLVVNPNNLTWFTDAERPRVYTVLQLRFIKKLEALRQRVQTGHYKVNLHYVTPRGKWYAHSWKGDPAKSGGLLTNIGIHMFDLLLWLFGDGTGELHARDTWLAGTYNGSLTLERADVDWLLSTADTPSGKAERWIEVDGERFVFDNFEDLHREVYHQTLLGHGHGIDDARPAVELVHRLLR